MTIDELSKRFWEVIEPLREFYEDTWSDERFDKTIAAFREECTEKNWDLQAFLDKQSGTLEELREHLRKGPPAFMRPGWVSPLQGKRIDNLDALLEDVEYIRRRECSETAKVTVIDFWATWCKYCMPAFPHLSDLQKQYGDKINVVAVCNDAYFDESGAKTPGSAEKINPHLTDDLACSFALDAKNRLRDTLFQPAGHRALPTTMVLNANNEVEYVGSPNDGTEFDDTIKRLLD
ncbi:hypothetical protein RI367_005699 [Sorochytrium milnesiophthora]